MMGTNKYDIIVLNEDNFVTEEKQGREEGVVSQLRVNNTNRKRIGCNMILIPSL